jgi:hypothetical protein
MVVFCDRTVAAVLRLCSLILSVLVLLVVIEVVGEMVLRLGPTLGPGPWPSWRGLGTFVRYGDFW